MEIVFISYNLVFYVIMGVSGGEAISFWREQSPVPAQPFRRTKFASVFANCAACEEHITTNSFHEVSSFLYNRCSVLIKLAASTP